MNRSFARPLLGLLAAFLCSVACAGPALEVVRETSEQVVARIQSERPELEREPAKLYGLVEELIAPNFDFPRMSQWVLGKHWGRAEAADKTAFTREFRVLLIRTYAKALLEYTDKPIAYLGEQPDSEGKTITVRTSLAQGDGKAFDINYRMLDSGAGPKVVDVTVGGVSLVATYRGEFSEKVRRDGLGGLIATLAERNAARVQ